MDPITRDFYEERRRGWRRSAFWRGVLVTVVLLLVIGGIGAWFSGAPLGPHIARVVVDEVIFTDRERDRMLAEIAQAENVRALIVHIDSPGGTVVGSEALYESLSRVRTEMPVVAVMDSVAASGGYLAALGAEHIVARGNTVTGSIGVIFEYLTFTDLMDRLGVGLETIRSSDLKAAPSQFRELSPAARAAEQAIVNETFSWFQTLVADERGLEGSALDSVTDGRTFTGRMALAAGLIDEIGDEQTAKNWLEGEDPDLADLPVHTWEWDRPGSNLPPFFARLLPIGGALSPNGFAEGPRLMSILK